MPVHGEMGLCLLLLVLISIHYMWHIRCGKSNAFIMRYYFVMIHIQLNGILSSWIVHVISSIHNVNRVSIHRKSSAIDGFKSKDLLAQDFTVCMFVYMHLPQNNHSLFITMSFKIRLSFVISIISFKFNLLQTNAKGLHNVHKMHKKFNERKLYHKHVPSHVRLLRFLNVDSKKGQYLNIQCAIQNSFSVHFPFCYDIDFKICIQNAQFYPKNVFDSDYSSICSTRPQYIRWWDRARLTMCELSVLSNMNSKLKWE